MNVIDCSLGGPVLNLLWPCPWVKIKTFCFFLFTKHVFEQFVMPPKKKLKADRHTADAEKGFSRSAQNLICASQRIKLTTENQDILLWVQMEAPREVKGQLEWVMKVTGKWRQREGDVIH